MWDGIYNPAQDFHYKHRKRGREEKPSGWTRLWVSPALQAHRCCEQHLRSRTAPHHPLLGQEGSTVLGWAQIPHGTTQQAPRTTPQTRARSTSPPASSGVGWGLRRGGSSPAPLLPSGRTRLHSTKFPSKHLSWISSEAESLPALDSFRSCFLVRACLLVYSLLKDKKRQEQDCQAAAHLGRMGCSYLGRKDAFCVYFCYSPLHSTHLHNSKLAQYSLPSLFYFSIWQTLLLISTEGQIKLK